MEKLPGQASESQPRPFQVVDPAPIKVNAQCRSATPSKVGRLRPKPQKPDFRNGETVKPVPDFPEFLLPAGSI